MGHKFHHSWIAIAWILVNIFLFFWCDTSSGVDPGLHFPAGIANEMLLVIVWINLLFIPGFALRRLSKKQSSLPLEEICLSLAYTLALYTPLSIIWFLLQLSVSSFARIIYLANIIMLVLFLRGIPRQKAVSTGNFRGQSPWDTALLCGLLITVAALMRFFLGSMESDAYGYINIINRYFFLNKALLKFPWDQTGGILISYLASLSLFLGAVVVKTTGIHPLVMWLLSPVVLAPISLFVVVVLVQRLTGNMKAGVFVGWGLVLLVLSKGLCYIGWDVWANWWISILFPRQFVYHILSPLLVLLFFILLGETKEDAKKTFFVLCTLCCLSGIINIPAGPPVIGQILILCALYQFIIRKPKLPFSWWLTYTIILACLLPNLIIVIYGYLHLPSNTGVLSMASYHKQLLRQAIGTFSHQPYLCIFTVIILGTIPWVRKEKNILLLNLSFLIMVVPFFIPQFRKIVSMIFPSPVVFTRMMIYIPFWGAIGAGAALYFTGNALRKITKVNLFYFFVPLLILLFYFNYPSSRERMNYRLDRQSRYNKIVMDMLGRGKELLPILKKIEPRKRMLVAGNPEGMGQFRVREIQIITGRNLAPWFSYQSASNTFMSKPVFGPRNQASLFAAKMLEAPSPESPHWWLKLKKMLGEGDLGYIIFFLEDSYVAPSEKDRLKNSLQKLMDSKRVDILFSGKYTQIIKIK